MIHALGHLGIKIKLLVLFIIIKIIPLVLVAWIAIEGAENIRENYKKDSAMTLTESRTVVEKAARTAINGSIEALDRKSQTNLERLTKQIALHVADFLYERDQDLLVLANSQITQERLQLFFEQKTRPVTVHGDYRYDDASSRWLRAQIPDMNASGPERQTVLSDNRKEFHYIQEPMPERQILPLYKEVTFFDLKGREQVKVSKIEGQLKDISDKKQTYIHAETYFSKISKLRKGEIFVSQVVGAYVPSKVIGTYTKEKVKKLGLPFQPEKEGYAGVENPQGRRFDGIVRFVTPVFEGNRKVGYVSLALDHIHLMEFTDHVDPTDKAFTEISNAAEGNYAFMWDNLGRNISHARDYFIVGYDPNSGAPVPGWLSADLAERFKKSGYTDINQFLATSVTPFESQSLQKKPNLEQLKRGEVALDCRYLNFAPQCHGWMQLTEHGGYGSFIIFWSGVWKLTTAAAIPYYTGQYGQSKRGFGFVTLGANVDEFHLAASTSKKEIEADLAVGVQKIEQEVQNRQMRVLEFVQNMISNLFLSTSAMVIIVIFIAIWMSDHITKRIELLREGARRFAENDLDHKIEVNSKDEVGDLAESFNQMASSIGQLIREQAQLNVTLESRVAERTREIQDLLDNTGQGFLAFGSDYEIQAGHSKACQIFLGENLVQQNILELLFAGQKEVVQEALDLVFRHSTPLENLLDFLPTSLSHKGRQLTIEYHWIPEGHSSENGRVMLILTDNTREYELTQLLRKDEEDTLMITKVAIDREGFLLHLKESKGIIELTHELAVEGVKLQDLQDLFRAYHTIKSGFASYCFVDTTHCCHELETLFADIVEKEGQFTEFDRQILTELLEALELSLNRSLEKLGGLIPAELCREEGPILYKVSESKIANVLGLLEDSQESSNYKDIKHQVELLRWQPIEPILKKYSNDAYYLANRLGKQIRVELEGVDVELDLQHFQHVFATLTHLIRNSIDHGIEPPEIRLQNKKEECGVIRIQAHRNASSLQLVIADDGRGIDPIAIQSKAVEKGILGQSEAENFPMNQIFQLIFQPGFSTKQEITLISGRGLGMSAVAAAVQDVNGKIDIESHLNEGTIFRLNFPIEA